MKVKFRQLFCRHCLSKLSSYKDGNVQKYLLACRKCDKTKNYEQTAAEGMGSMKEKLNERLTAIAAKIKIGLPLTQGERALWALYGEERSYGQY